MKIIYKDGGILECSSIEISGGCIYADELYIVEVEEIEIITD